MFSTKSGSDKGTLFQLKNLIHQTSVSEKPECNVKATEDFLEVVLEAHIVAAANELLASGWDGTLQQLAEKIIDTYVHILPDVAGSCSDEVHIYASEVLSLGLLWYNYVDAVREGDGKCVMLLWKFLLLIFKKTRHKNYAKEAAVLLIQHKFLFSERKVLQLENSCFVNTRGMAGCNMSCDLYMEHLNHRLKGVIRHMGSNIQPPSLVRAAKAIGVVDAICRLFENETRGKTESGIHRKRSFHLLLF